MGKQIIMAPDSQVAMSNPVCSTLFVLKQCLAQSGQPLFVQKRGLAKIILKTYFSIPSSDSFLLTCGGIEWVAWHLKIIGHRSFGPNNTGPH